MRRTAFVFVITGLALAGCGSSTHTATVTTLAAQAGTPGGTTPTTKVPGFSGSSSSSFCDDARRLSQTTRFTPDTTNLKTVFQDFDSYSGRLESKAPSAIKADVKTVVDAVKRYEGVLQGVNFDYTKLTPAQLQAFTDPNVTSASERVTAYLAQVCHVSTATSTT
jgi:hypothetical protein